MSPLQALELQRSVGNRAASTLLGQPLQRLVKARTMGTLPTQSHATLTHVAAQFGVTRAALVDALATKLVASPLFPAAYQREYVQSDQLKTEVRAIAGGLDDLIAAADSRQEIVAGDAQVDAVAEQLFSILTPSITAGRLSRHVHYLLSTSLGAPGADAYLQSLTLVQVRLAQYVAQTDEQAWQPAQLEQNDRMDERRRQLQAMAGVLHAEITQAVRGNNAVAAAAAVVKVRGFLASIDDLEQAWDLDFRFGQEGTERNVANLARGTSLERFHAPGGGADDNMSLKDTFGPQLACSLYALLAVKGGTWLGKDHPEGLHNILRKTGALREYDDNKAAAHVRVLAGLTGTTIAGNTSLRTYVQQRKTANDHRSFIADVEGTAHTFAAVWKGGDFKKVDDTGSNGDLSQYFANRMVAVWYA